MISTIVGYKKRITVSRRTENAESFEPTEGEWRVLQEWLESVIIGYYGEKPSWRCVPLFSAPGGFIATKLVI